MFKWYADTFEITERHLTRKNIRRISIASWIVFLSLLLEFIDVDWAFEHAPVIVPISLAIMVLIVIAAIIVTLASPLVLRFWARDKYLDEWELDVKRRGMKSGYTVLLFALLAAVLILLFQVDYSVEDEPMSLTRVDVAEWALNFMIAAVFFQIQTQLRRIRPIDAEEWDEDAVEKSTVWGKAFIVLAVLFVLIGPPFCQGLADGFNETRHNAEANKSVPTDVTQE